MVFGYIYFIYEEVMIQKKKKKKKRMDLTKDLSSSNNIL